jgi:hypothetical protein
MLCSIVSAFIRYRGRPWKRLLDFEDLFAQRYQSHPDLELAARLNLPPHLVSYKRKTPGHHGA